MTVARLRASAFAAMRLAALPVLPAERLLACERVAAGLDRLPDARPRALAAVADEVREHGAGALDDAALRVVLERGWVEPGQARLALAVLAEALARRRRSLDRAVVRAARHCPRAHPAVAVLDEAAALAARRHGWPQPEDRDG